LIRKRTGKVPQIFAFYAEQTRALPRKHLLTDALSASKDAANSAGNAASSNTKNESAQSRYLARAFPSLFIPRQKL
jgi:hypothetical protein